jgi:periplasmic protein TonB
MKLALFLLLSFAVHATAFLVPITLMGRATNPIITVTIRALEFAPDQSGAGDGSGTTTANRVASKPKTPSNERRGDLLPRLTGMARENNPVEKPAAVADKGTTAITEVATDGIPAVTGASLASGHATGAAIFGTETIGGGTGNGSGNGASHGNGQYSAALTQARYRDTPQPHYPDSARREGKEGRVLLRVLVDEQGKTKAIEVNTSSGHDLLDRAATDAIKNWRFVPARVGGKPIETWVNVPIEFQLSNAKP